MNKFNLGNGEKIECAPEVKKDPPRYEWTNYSRVKEGNPGATEKVHEIHTNYPISRQMELAVECIEGAETCHKKSRYCLEITIGRCWNRYQESQTKVLESVGSRLNQLRFEVLERQAEAEHKHRVAEERHGGNLPDGRDDEDDSDFFNLNDSMPEDEDTVNIDEDDPPPKFRKMRTADDE